MADTQTTSFVLTKPEVGASRDVWGPKLNTNFDRIDDAMLGFYTAGGTGNAITITTGMSLTSVPTGMKIRFRVGSANTGATTINVDGIGAQTAVTVTGVALPNGYTRTGVDTVATWDGSNWTVDRQPERGGTIGTGGIYTKLADGSLFQIKTGSVPNTNTAIGSSFRSAAQAPCFRFDVGLMCVSPCLLCFLFCMFTLCHPIEHMCVNAPPSGLPIPDPYCITSSVCLLIAQSHCPNHFVLHDSRRDRLPTLSVCYPITLRRCRSCD